ncbi:hypothetical protein DL769_005078 [Monosporascus sp. CRB-8-3]|nr:hypothetical protein DL769_005078 [Monosporascus sp. CRB-8-3]
MYEVLCTAGSAPAASAETASAGCGLPPATHWTPEKRGRAAIVQLLLDTGKVDADAKDKYDRTPLLCAAEDGHKAVVQLLKLL